MDGTMCVSRTVHCRFFCLLFRSTTLRLLYNRDSSSSFYPVNVTDRSSAGLTDDVLSIKRMKDRVAMENSLAHAWVPETWKNWNDCKRDSWNPVPHSSTMHYNIRYRLMVYLDSLC